MALLHKQQAMREELGDRAGLTITWWNMGEVLEDQNQLEAALALRRKAIAMRKELGLPTDTSPWSIANLEARVRAEGGSTSSA